MHNSYRGGMPDVYYEGDRAILWAEYKYIPKIPKKLCLAKYLTPLQNRWLRRAYQNNIQVAVIAGVEDGVFIAQQPNQWELTYDGEFIRATAIDIKGATNWIEAHTLCESTLRGQDGE